MTPLNFFPSFVPESSQVRSSTNLLRAGFLFSLSEFILLDLF
jgi:hypothetical protein